MFSVYDVSPEEFEQYVYDCLLHLYDYAVLQDHPLVHRLVPHALGANRVQIFRDVVTEAIERLRPGIGLDFNSREARSYNILSLRYLDRQQTQDVIDQLGISERQFYREHPKAIQAISHILRERLSGASPPSDTANSATISVESEVQWVHNQAEPTPFQMEDLLRGVLSAAQSLADQHQINLKLAQIDQTSALDADRTVLRQVIIWILSQLIVHSPQGAQLTVTSEVVNDNQQITFLVQDGTIDAHLLQTALEKQEALSHLIAPLDGQLHYRGVSTRAFEVTLQMRLKRRTILVVDDNPGMIDLLRRYLVGQPYQTVGVYEAKQAIQFARKSQPNVIILDVMLPGQDGWEVLQNLKNHPTTRHIPVIICSVLDVLEWAYSLGADGYLRKPPGQAAMLDELARWAD